MTRKYVLTAGLPRAGTTLLGTILNQNPRFTASISGPLARFTRAIIQESGAQAGYQTECPPEKVNAILKNMFDSYYQNDNEVCFNHNRGWPLLFPAVKAMYPDIKLIVCVRDVNWVLDSFEVLHRKNPFSPSKIFSTEENINVYSRAESLLQNNRTVGFAYSAVKEALCSEYNNDIMFIEYDNLASHPEKIVHAVYNFIDEPYFKHDFGNVAAEYPEFDEEVQLPGLHTTRQKVELLPRQPVIPPDLWQHVAQNFPSVWK